MSWPRASKCGDCSGIPWRIFAAQWQVAAVVPLGLQPRANSTMCGPSRSRPSAPCSARTAGRELRDGPRSPGRMSSSPGPAQPDSTACNLPRQVVRILDARVHAEPTRGGNRCAASPARNTPASAETVADPRVHHPMPDSLDLDRQIRHTDSIADNPYPNRSSPTVSDARVAAHHAVSTTEPPVPRGPCRRI